jgi:hypothetical protein
MLLRGSHRWAQVGWLEWQGDERVTFVQYTPVDEFQGLVTAYFPARPLGLSSEYKVLKRGDAFQFYGDGISYGAGTVSWTPNEAHLGGEIRTLASQMPGGYNNSYEWYSLSDVELGMDNWQSFAGVLSWPTYGEFGSATTSPYQHRIWDWSCPY